MKNSRYNQERGVALLFALGVMSLMLVTGVAFLANALVSQKIAVNNSSLGQSRLLARSAADRILMQLMMLERSKIVHKDNRTYVESDPADSIYSFVRTNATDPDPEINSAAPDANKMISDQLVGTSSKLNVKNNNFNYEGQNSKAKWVYIHADGSESQGTAAKSSKIIGRYSYQLLPRQTKSNLSLYAITAGETRIAGKTSAGSRVPHKYRWGMDGDELMIPGCQNGSGADDKMFEYFWGNKDHYGNPQPDFENFIGSLSSPEVSPKVFVGLKNNVKFQKQWLRYWFSEGRGRLAPEAYLAYDGTNFVRLPRFNVGPLTSSASNPVDDAWYTRLFSVSDDTLDNLKNQERALTRLTSKNIKNYDETKVWDYNNQNATDFYGLPFLRCIGRSGANFKTGTRTDAQALGYLRKQIAANFNDYCDSDNIPTSDVAADTWTSDSVYKDRSSAQPSYTGNEKTPYINEVALMFPVTGTKFATGSDKCSSVKVKTTITISPSMLLEAVDIYGLNSTNWPVSSLKMKARCNITKTKFRLKATVSAIQVYYMDNDNKKSKSLSDTFTIDDVFTSTKNVSLSFGDDSDELKYGNGYYTGHKTLGTDDTFTMDLDLSNVITTEIEKLQSNLDSVKSLTLSDVYLQLKSVEFEMSDLVLYRKGTSNIGLDYVRMPTGTINAQSPDDEYKIENTAKSFGSGVLKPKRCIFFVGNMEARDPRQNLNIVGQNNAEGYKSSEHSDWFFQPKIALHSNAESSDPPAVISMTPTYNTFSLGTLVNPVKSLAGKQNSVSSPKEPKKGTGDSMTSGNFDVETADSVAATAEDTPVISTAVIRNAPMRSLWEIGFIHRGAAWQTINLKKAGGYETNTILTSADHYINDDSWEDTYGTDYTSGDAGILDAVKLTDHVKAYTKVNLYDLKETAKPSVSGSTTTAATWNKYIANALFEGIREQGTAANFLKESLNDVPTTQTGTLLTSPHGDNLSGIDFSKNGTADAPPLRSFMLTQSSDFAAKTTVATVFKTETTDTTDAAKEELIGKTMNLVDVIPAEPVVFKAIIVAQSIRELPQGTAVPGETETATIGKFDIGTNGIDQILGETKMLVTFEKVNYIENVSNEYQPRARLRIRQIEYLD